MASIIYALSGQGRGHTSRVIAVTDELRRRGHEVVLCCGGTAREIMESRGERVIPVPALRQIIEQNKVQLGRTAAHNWRTVLDAPRIVADLADAFRDEHPDLLITDFEAFSPRAARRIGLPILSFNHQQVVTETRYFVPPRFWPNYAVTSSAIRFIAPSDPAHLLLTSFYFPPLRRTDNRTLVAPIIRAAVQDLAPQAGDDTLVYFNQPEGADEFVDLLRRIDAQFTLYNFPAPEAQECYPNLTFKAPSLDGFLADLARCRAVLCTAGFTLMSEALFLGKPLLVVPNRGIFEQTLNALFLQREGLGRAVIERPITLDDVRSFLQQHDAYQARMLGRASCGNTEAVACIEGLLARRRAFSGYAPAANGRAARPASSPTTKQE